MKTKVGLSGFLMILLLTISGYNASGIEKIEIGGTGRISGMIKNAESGIPVKYAAVTLYSATDSSMVAGTITNNEGRFVVSMLAAGSYFIEISEPGYEKKQITGLDIKLVLPKIDAGEIHLMPDIESGKKRTKNRIKSRNS